jgi:hypothetical protein
MSGAGVVVEFDAHQPALNSGAAKVLLTILRIAMERNDQLGESLVPGGEDSVVRHREASTVP